MTTPTANFINLNSPPLLKSSDATNIIFKRVDGELHFHKVENNIFRNNLILVDGWLPEILGEVVIYAYSNKCFELAAIVEAIEKFNPLKYRTKYEMKFYTYKIKELLKNLALGMTAKEVWNGPGSIYDHFPVFTHEDEVIYYTDNKFLDSLFEKAKLKIVEVPKIVKTLQDGQPFIGLNLQIEI